MMPAAEVADWNVDDTRFPGKALASLVGNLPVWARPKFDGRYRLSAKALHLFRIVCPAVRTHNQHPHPITLKVFDGPFRL